MCCIGIRHLIHSYWITQKNTDFTYSEWPYGLLWTASSSGSGSLNGCHWPRPSRGSTCRGDSTFKQSLRPSKVHFQRWKFTAIAQMRCEYYDTWKIWWAVITYWISVASIGMTITQSVLFVLNNVSDEFFFSIFFYFCTSNKWDSSASNKQYRNERS